MRKIYDSKDYRAKLALRWKNDEFKLKLIDKIKDSLINKWQSEDYKRKMAIARSKMPIENTTIENKLYNILTDFEIKFKKQYVIGYCVFDCYLPDYNILIECNGDYWHNLPNSKRNDRTKSTYIEKYFPQMKLYYIWEHEFKCYDKVCRLIEYWTGLKKETVDFNFNKVLLRELDDVKEYKYFISNYHYLQSAGNPIYKYGFFIGEELIAVCLYGYPTRKESAIKLNVGYREVLELTRLCIHPKYHKQNFASWMISKTIKKLKQLKKYKYLLSFSDKTFNHIGTVYKASNWQFDGVVPPSYWYVDNSGFVMNKKTLYNHARSLRMKEKDFAELYGYHKVKGNIKLRFIYEL